MQKVLGAFKIVIFLIVCYRCRNVGWLSIGVSKLLSITNEKWMNRFMKKLLTSLLTFIAISAYADGITIQAIKPIPVPSFSTEGSPLCQKGTCKIDLRFSDGKLEVWSPANEGPSEMLGADQCTISYTMDDWKNAQLNIFPSTAYTTKSNGFDFSTVEIKSEVFDVSQTHPVLNHTLTADITPLYPTCKTDVEYNLPMNGYICGDVRTGNFKLSCDQTLFRFPNVKANAFAFNTIRRHLSSYFKVSN